jgi:hypothetical protein
VLNKRDKKRLEAAQMRFLKAITRMYKIRPSKKCRYKGKISGTKHSRRNLNMPEELETSRKDAS